MLGRKNLHRYQKFGAAHLIKHPFASLFFEMGLGKSVSTLTALVDLKDLGEVTKTLIVAPLRVANHTWPEEIESWKHTKHLTYAKVTGSLKERRKALREKTDIHIINRENIPWLVAELEGTWPYDLVIIDESSSFKNHQSNRFKALKTVRPLMKRVILLTGTPSPNSLIDLWPQLYLLDRGERLGKTISEYRRVHFSEGRKKENVVFNYVLKKSQDDLLGEDIHKALIYDKISDICISMKTRDWLDLPPTIIRDFEIKMPQKIKKDYEEFEKKAVLELLDSEITAVNAAALTNKLLQFANGAIYSEGKKFTEIHDLKLKALEEILEANVGNPVLCFYNFKHDVERICKKLKHYEPKLLDGGNDIDQWNKGKIPFLLAHPASAGHGLNMQHGGNVIVWFGLPWSLELYQQANARLDRQGQKKSVIIERIKIAGTMDEDVISALERKDVGQEALMQAVKAKIAKYAI